MREGSASWFTRLSLASVSAWLAVFAVAPALLVLTASFLARGQAEFVVPEFSLAGYAHILDPIFLQVFLRSVYIAGGATLCCLLAGYPFAYLLSRLKVSPGRKRLLLLLVIIPFWTNSLVRTYALMFLLKTQGLLNQALLGLGIIDAPLSLLYTDLAVFIGLTYAMLPFMILPIYASVERLDPRLMEAARDLGAGRIRTFTGITLPMTMPGVVAGCMLVFFPALSMFYIPDLLGGAKSMLIGNYIKNQFLTFRNWPAGSAAGVLLTLLLGLLLLAHVRLSRRTGAKGSGA